jgi:hypothetical protein
MRPLSSLAPDDAARRRQLPGPDSQREGRIRERVTAPIGASDLTRGMKGANRQKGREAGDQTIAGATSKSDAYAYPPPPNDAASLSHISVEELKTLRQRHHRKYFETGAAWRVIDQSAGDHGRLRVHDDLGLACLSTRGPNSLVQARWLGSWHRNPMVPSRQLLPL